MDREGFSTDTPASRAQVEFNPRVYERDGKLWTSSLDVARVFGKRHDDVLRKIKTLDCSEDFRLRNFTESSYANDQNKIQPMFEMTKDGWAFLVMGFTGKAAAKFKEGYIKAFNKMEDSLSHTIAFARRLDLWIERSQTIIESMAVDTRANRTLINETKDEA